MNEHELILTAIKNCDRTSLYADSKELNPEEQSRYNQILARRSAGEPLQYLIGFTEFMGLKIHVNRHVLIPRPETEILVEKTIQEIKKRFGKRPIDVLDLGTGSGNIAIALTHFLDNVRVKTVDVSYEALSVARSNAKLHNVYNRIEFVCCDMKKFLMNTDEEFDLIISNPPYIAHHQMKDLPVDVQKEPKLALDGGKDGFDYYQHIIKNGFKLLTKHGFCMMELGDHQDQEIQSLVKKECKSFITRFHEDYRQINRIAEIRKD